MLKNLAIAFGLAAGLSACAAPYGYTGYGNTGYGYAEHAITGQFTMAPATTQYTPASTARCNLDQARSIVR